MEYRQVQIPLQGTVPSGTTTTSRPWIKQRIPLYRRRTLALVAAGGCVTSGQGPTDDGRVPGQVTLEADDVQLLVLFAEGLTTAGIARRMNLNERTVRRRLSRLCERLGVSTPIEAVVLAVRHGVI